MLALGLIETKGLIGAIEAADAMLKAADVRLLEKSLASGGLVTITIAGEVAAVQSSVDAAAASIARIEGAECVSRHVIPRPDAELEHILLLQPRSIEIEAAAPAEAAPCTVFERRFRYERATTASGVITRKVKDSVKKRRTLPPFRSSKPRERSWPRTSSKSPPRRETT